MWSKIVTRVFGGLKLYFRVVVSNGKMFSDFRSYIGVSMSKITCFWDVWLWLTQYEKMLSLLIKGLRHKTKAKNLSLWKSSLVGFLPWKKLLHEVKPYMFQSKRRHEMIFLWGCFIWIHTQKEIPSRFWCKIKHKAFQQERSLPYDISKYQKLSPVSLCFCLILETF